MFEIEKIISMKMDLALNNLQRLINHKTQTTNQPTNQNQQCALSAKLGIQKVKSSSKKGYSGYNTKMHLMNIWGEWRMITSLPLIPGSLKHRLVVPVRVTFEGQIDLFKSYLYLIGLYEKKPLTKQLHKKCKQQLTMNVIP